jgi:hypothetical protein
MKDKTEIHPTYLGWQVDWPLFVKMKFSSGGRNWTKGEEFKWAELGVLQDVVSKLYSVNFVHHNPELEKQNKVGDRLHEMNEDQLKTLVLLLNAELKKRTVSTKDFNEKRCRQSRIANKQRGLIRRFLYSNKWCEEVFYDIRDKVLNDTVPNDT